MEIGRKEQLIILCLAGALLFGGGFKLAGLKDHPEAPLLVKQEETIPGQREDESGDSGEIPEGPAEKVIFVHVAGAVAKPGLYEVPEGSRVNEALGLAQPLPEADLNSLNLAERLADGQKIMVLAQGIQPEGQQGSGNKSTGQGSRININTATMEELDSLPGIGPSLAQRILNHRQQKGFFKSVEDLCGVSGIGDKKFAEISDYITY